MSNDDYRRLLEFRTGLRRFLHWSEEQAAARGVSPAQHQLLLAIRGHAGDPTIKDLAHSLVLRHHSVVGLVDRAEAAGFVRRHPDHEDARAVRVQLTPRGNRCLEALAASHLAELERLVPRLARLWSGLDAVSP